MAFPKPHMDREKYERWIRACRREVFDVDNVTKHTNICSLHLICVQLYIDPICTSNFFYVGSYQDVLKLKVTSLPDVC